MSARMTPSRGYRTNPASPMSPFRFNEDSLRVFAGDIEANVTTIPMNNLNQVNTRRSQPRIISQPGSPGCSLSSPASSPVWQRTPSHRNVFSHSLGTPVKTVRDYEDSVKEMKKENFNLKLKIFFLEERLAVGNENRNVGLLADNIDLKVQVESLRQEVMEKQSLLSEAGEAIEQLESKMKLQEDLNKKGHYCNKNTKNVEQTRTRTKDNEFKNLTTNNLNKSTESLVMEVLEELEEFTEREKNFDEKYVKTINQMKSEAEKTELELSKIKSKMTECEEEIESLNSNLDTKNEFISALQRDNANKREETEYLVNQLQKSNNVVKIMEREMMSVRAKQSKRKSKPPQLKTKGVGTETNNYEIIKVLEDEIHFKNQEIREFIVEIKCQEEKIKRLENLKLTPGKSTDNDSDKENIWREKLEDQAISNNHLEAQLKLQVHERKLLLKKISLLNLQLDTQKQRSS